MAQAHRLKFRKARTLLPKKQTHIESTNKESDKKRTALKPGLRISKYGNLYTETRANRSDKNPKNKL